MLKDLILPTKMERRIQKSTANSKVPSVDTEIACNLVDILFKHVVASIQMDRSEVKLNALTRGMIGGVLSQTRFGTKEYIAGMRNDDVKLLLDDIEKELKRRRL